MKAYEKLRNDLKTGDIVLFSGKGGLSTAIKWFTFSEWSHVGMVLRISQWDAVMLWESTTLSNIADVISGRERKGVQIVPLSERIKHYNGNVAIRTLETKKLKNVEEKLSALRSEVKGRPYEENQIELLKSAYDGPFGKNEEDLSSLFCSELVAEAYQRLGLLPEDKPSNEYTPKDFSKSGGIQLIDSNLSDEYLIKKG